MEASSEVDASLLAVQPGPGGGSAAAASAASAAPAAMPTGMASPSRVALLRRLARGKVERSCIVCHRRKVRCDKTAPCSNCMRSGVLCCYPSEDRPRRQPKTTIAGIAQRLVQLERTIVAVAGGDAGSANEVDDDGVEVSAGSSAANDGGGSSGRPLVTALHKRETDSMPTLSAMSAPERGGVADDDDTASEAGAGDARDILLKNSYSSYYINEVLLSRVLEEEQELRSAMNSPRASHADDAAGDIVDVGNPFITLFGSLGTSPHVPRLSSVNLHPERLHAIQLWQVYLQRAMVKVFHVPTTEVEVFTAIESHGKTDPSFESLLFAIYYAAATTYQPEAYLTAFGEEKTLALDRFRTGMERALVQARFLETPNLRTLQALTLYLESSRAHSPGRSIWILYGVLLRAAQSIGLHRDGATFHLSPFECEMRRRLLGCLFTQDARAAEDHGIDIGLLSLGPDVQPALNLNDSDLYPEMTALPPPQRRWTEMTIAVCLRHLRMTAVYVAQLISATKTHLARGAAAAGASTASLITLQPLLTASAQLVPLTEERRHAIMTERNAYVEELMGYCSPVVPVQRMTLKTVRLVQLKFDFVSRLQLATILAGNDGGDASSATAMSASLVASEENLTMACEVVELNIAIMTDDMVADFRWSAEMYPQYHTLLYVLWHLCLPPPARPSGVSGSSIALRARAWAAANSMFAMEAARQKRQSLRGHNAKWTVLTAMREKAKRVRGWPRLGSADKTTQWQPPPEGDAAGNGMEVDSSSVQQPRTSSDVPIFSTAGSSPAVGASTRPAAQSAMPGPSPPSTPAPYQPGLADAGMVELLNSGATSLDVGMDMSWTQGYVDWSALSEDFWERSGGP